MSSPSTSEKSKSDQSCTGKVCTVHKGAAIACCCAAIASLVPVALFQLHAIDDLPDPPGTIFDSKKIVTSKSAYRLGIPDGVLGLGSYGVTLGLLIAAKPSRPRVRKLLRGKLALDGTMAVRNARRQITQFGRICSWCMGTAIATAGVVYFARKAGAAERLRSD
jgi:Vitamin K epoxide reductase family